MRLELTGRHVVITPALRRLVDTKLSKLKRLLNDSAVSAQAVLTREKHIHRADITLHARGEKFLHGFASTDSWETSIVEAIAKISRQARTVKGKWQERTRRGPKGAPIAPAAAAVETAVRKPARAARPEVPHLVHATRQPIKPMSVSDAIREMEAVGDGVVIFRSADTAAVHVLYRARNGELTLVETET
jgi:putative sigma-54 modulation protein